MILAVLGIGGVGLRAIGLWDDLEDREKLAFALPLGFGFIGWAVFFPGVAGLYSQPLLLGGLLICALGAVVWWGHLPSLVPSLGQGKGWIWILGLACLVLLVLGLDVVGALMPPTDADSTTYHFTLPKQFFTEGAITFVPRAASGAVPLLVQMTYLPAYGLGGELGMTFWVMVVGWMTTLVIYLFARRYLEPIWALALALIFSTVPAVIYGAGSGQVEVKNALFVLGAAFAVVEARRTGDWRYALLAGVLAGYFAGSKYLGLMFVAAAGLSVLLHRKWLHLGVVFGVGAVLSGIQWYGWNWWHTGDPVFPMLYGPLGLADTDIWNSVANRQFIENFLRYELSVPRNLLWFLLYPFQATFVPLPIFESGRTGLGIFGVAILPFTIGGLWLSRERVLRHPLFTVGLIAVLYYGLWFFVASSQRIRHFLPIYPLVMLCLGVAAQRFAVRMGLIRPLVIAFGVTLAIQTAVLVVFSKNALTHVVRGETRDAYLERVLIDYDAARWANANLTQSDRIATLRRNLLYYIDVPTFYIHHYFQAMVDARPDNLDVDKFLRQLKEQKITHIMLGVTDTPPQELALTLSLLERGDAEVIAKVTGKLISSRTLPRLAGSKSRKIWMIKLVNPN